MTILFAVAIAALLFTLTLASYVDRLYFEMGKFLAREFQENIDAWEQRVEPRLGASRERIGLSAAVLTQLSLACVTLLFGAMLFDRNSLTDRPTFGEIAQVVFGVVLVIVIFNRLLPFVFFTRTRGLWVVRFRTILRLLFWLVLPVTFLLSFLLSIAALAETPEAEEDDTSSEAVDALIEAGEEEGIIEKGDRDLVRSAVEFGDKVVHEVMTPRPRVFAVAETTTLEEFLQQLVTNPYSRVPVYRETIDQITGIAYSHDLLQIADSVASTRTVASIQRPASFVPEVKKVNELLREMQRAKHHMRIVIDEYGGVAGLVTIEDLLEEIVGNITDEHEQDAEKDEPIAEPGGSWIVPGSLDIERLEELMGETWQKPDDYEATTVAGLVSETAGRIPSAGEVIEDEYLRFEVLASTDRRIERVRVSKRARAS
jgi:CBS domain containing-hemolysin-like protein